MYTYKQLTNYANAHGLRFEVHKTELGYELGINNLADRAGRSEWSWTWFECYDEEVNDNTEFFFRARYSMLNGKTYRSIDERIKVRRLLENEPYHCHH